MVYRGRVEKGVVVLEGNPPLPDGTPVRVEAVVQSAEEAVSATAPTWGEVLRDFVGQVEGLPSDWAKNHDHYIHGAPKR